MSVVEQGFEETGGYPRADGDDLAHIPGKPGKIPLLGTIKSTSFGAIGALVNFAVAYIVSGSTKETPQHIKDLVASVRVPRGAGAAVEGH